MNDAGSAQMRSGRRGMAMWMLLASVLTVVVVISGTWWFLSGDAPGNDPGQERTLVTFALTGGNLTVDCEVADTPQERRTGLMYREYLPEDAGMLFVFDPPMDVSFWMKDTLIPLDMVFVNDSGYVTGIWEAFPEPGVPDEQLTRYPSPGPVRWVVEMNQGVCAENGVVPGTRVCITYCP